jgi:hypothetical protein
MPFLEPVDVTAEEWLTAVAEADGVFLPLAVTAEAFEKVAAEAMPFLPEEVTAFELEEAAMPLVAFTPLADAAEACDTEAVPVLSLDSGGINSLTCERFCDI